MGKLAQDLKVQIGGKSTVLYMGPADGPFRCGRCEYFQKPTSCELVAGTIDADGCCSLYEPSRKPSAQMLGALKKAGQV